MHESRMSNAPEVELRISLDPEALLGPDKAALLQAIDETGRSRPPADGWE